MGSMTAQLLVLYAVLWATLMKALLVRYEIIPASCSRCGQVFERRSLGEPVCRCGS
jgi:hypothetical protein